ncbi:adenosylcobinamide-GDP ribazoletransferase [Janibacter anophelis]|uniref:adenosylcobinamide-GDP ribazoletransferase n=1 Tax=Janibacter anophelis TaxID=319054 RepID=UPI003F81704D
MSLGEGLRLATGTFTRSPSGQVTITPVTARWALLLAPLAVVPLALQVLLVGLTVEVGVPPLVAAAAALGVLAYGTRAMHLDGLADTVDGLGAGWTRERALQVMRSGDVGPMGVAALVLVLVAQAAAMATLLSHGWLGALTIGAAVIASRAAAAVVCATGHPASEGSRLGAAFVGSVPPATASLLALTVTAVLVLSVWPVVLAHGDAPDMWAVARLVAAAAAAAPMGLWAAIVLRAKAARAFGGVSGDVIGAAVELALTVVLVTLTLGW